MWPLVGAIAAPLIGAGIQKAFGSKGRGGSLENLGENVIGRAPRTRQEQMYTPEQQAALAQLLQMGMFNQDFKPQEDYARQQFASNTIPTIMQRFRGSGDNMASSGLGALLKGGGVGLESQLANLRSQHGMKQLGMGLGKQFDTFHDPGQPGILPSYLTRGTGDDTGYLSKLFDGNFFGSTKKTQEQPEGGFWDNLKDLAGGIF